VRTDASGFIYQNKFRLIVVWTIYTKMLG